MASQGDVLQERYRVVAQLGKGGMGAVYRAWDMRLSIPVALKEMVAPLDVDPALLENLRAQFQAEATVLARLSHPHLVGVTDYFQEGLNVYLVMKYVEGESLADRIQRMGPVPEYQAVIWAGQLLEALSYCHNQGVIHRDIKPQNIIIRPDGAAILVDFGLVKLWNPNDPRTRTAVRGVGTPHYSPPEQYELSAGHTEPRSDLYSLGATLYHTLTGQIPPSATLRVAAPEEFVPLRSIVREISPQLAAVIERAMELPRSRRWGSAAEMARALGIDVRGWGPESTSVLGVAGASGRDHTAVLPTGAPPSAARDARRSSEARGAKGQVAGVGTPRRRISLLIPIGIVVALLLVAGTALVALAFAGIVDLGLPTQWTPWLEVPGPTGAGTQDEVVAPTATPLPPSETVSPPTATATPAQPSPTTRATDAVVGGAKATLTPSPSPTLTPSSTVAPSPSPTLGPTSTAAPSPTVAPTATQAAATASPTAVPTPTAVAPAAGGVVVSFETWGVWRRGDQPYGELTQTQEQVKGGGYAAKLAYQFPDVADDYVVFVQSQSIAGQPDTLSAWVYGDGAGQYLNLWIKDAQGEIWSVHMGTIGGAGWQKLSGRLGPGQPWPSGRIGGPDNGAVDYPVQFYALVLDRPAANPSQGTIYIDEISSGGTP